MAIRAGPDLIYAIAAVRDGLVQQSRHTNLGTCVNFDIVHEPVHKLSHIGLQSIFRHRVVIVNEQKQHASYFLMLLQLAQMERLHIVLHHFIGLIFIFILFLSVTGS